MHFLNQARSRQVNFQAPGNGPARLESVFEGLACLPSLLTEVETVAPSECIRGLFSAESPQYSALDNCRPHGIDNHREHAVEVGWLPTQSRRETQFMVKRYIVDANPLVSIPPSGWTRKLVHRLVELHYAKSGAQGS